ncbi:hypothetical protein TSUD_276650 [Trifolium subterraneum]|uniref:Uncharacterized protein n=1 Tax=Trifolium subterraneum TaxID=3900 RepID=A0A2Z6P7Z4_TRISU|nr:hypothetical protein TSUD_276650 [Trifolium subterraneum]
MSATPLSSALFDASEALLPFSQEWALKLLGVPYCSRVKPTMMSEAQPGGDNCLSRRANVLSN